MAACNTEPLPAHEHESTRFRRSGVRKTTNTHSNKPSPYLLTPWCRVLLEKLTGLQLAKKFPAFHGTRRFITALTSVRQLSLSWVSPIQSIYQHPTYWKSIIILSTHLRNGLPIGFLPSGFPGKTLYNPLSKGQYSCKFLGTDSAIPTSVNVL